MKCKGARVLGGENGKDLAQCPCANGLISRLYLPHLNTAAADHNQIFECFWDHEADLLARIKHSRAPDGGVFDLREIAIERISTLVAKQAQRVGSERGGDIRRHWGENMCSVQPVSTLRCQLRGDY